MIIFLTIMVCILTIAVLCMWAAPESITKEYKATDKQLLKLKEDMTRVIYRLFDDDTRYIDWTNCSTGYPQSLTFKSMFLKEVQRAFKAVKNHHFNAEGAALHDSIREQTKIYVESEAFLDTIVERLHKKQLK